jgi:hypothetical protein
MAPLGYALQSVQDGLKSESNEWHFTQQAEKITARYLSTKCSGEADFFLIPLPAHALQPVTVELQ